MVRGMKRIVSRLLMLAGLTTLITMAVGLITYYLSTYYQWHNITHHMPAKAQAELQELIAAGQRGSDRYFELYERYGGDLPGVTDLGMIGLIGFISILVGGCVSVVLARRISRPIADVARAAARVSAGDRSARVDRGGVSGEVGELVDSFNRMAAEIQAYERERTVLTAGIAHELRTPLTILKGRLHGLADGVIDPATGEAHRLLRQVEQLSRLVEDLRTLAHADADELGLDQRRLRIDQVLHTAVADLAASAEQADVRLLEDYQPLLVKGDPVRLTQVFTNLLTNAIKHAPRGTLVTVQLCQRGGWGVVEVLDEGVGFAPDEEERLFIPFWRGAADKRLGRPGSGIGLALAAKLAEAHGGRITAQNRTDRSGACFAVWLPLLQLTE
ncbi:two-component system, OmpR family, sensor histidine kinase AdeS [Azospirillum sp. RU38E]|nr:two-component system, OmpR family, sensor histidine kinase AdeS [Azospirillum sp. RU38E]SNT08003.1 two-component system, OmpR family, sensor histidine kinase AdeS [Azospirillum sp. RU37A]